MSPALRARDLGQLRVLGRGVTEPAHFLNEGRTPEVDLPFQRFPDAR